MGGLCKNGEKEREKGREINKHAIMIHGRVDRVCLRSSYAIHFDAKMWPENISKHIVLCEYIIY